MREPLVTFTRHTEWAPQEGLQTQVCSADEDLLLVGGARASGKTDLGLALGCDPEYIEHPQFAGLVLRKDYDDLSDWINRARVFYAGLGTIIGNPAKIKWNAGGETRLGHWKDRNTISKYLGHEYQWMNIEELNETIHSEDEFTSLLGSLRSSINVKPRLYSSTNPGGPGHAWVKKFFVDMATDIPYTDPVSGRSRLFVPMTIEDNPILIANDPGYYNWLRTLPGLLGEMWYKGSWDIRTGQFFPEFNDSMSIHPHNIGARAATRLYLSVDVGIGHNTSAGLWYKADDGHIERLFTYVRNGFTHRYHAEQIRAKIERMGEYVDGAFPVQAVLGHDARRKARLNEDADLRSAEDEYMDVFSDTPTRFRVMNPDKKTMCGLMHEVISHIDGTPALMYWKGFNESFEEAWMNAMIDPDDPDVYMKNKKVGTQSLEKGDDLDINKFSITDDILDESGMGITIMWSDIAKQKQKRRMKKTEPTFVSFGGVDIESILEMDVSLG